MSYIVTVGYDEAARRYYVISSDIPGLNVETDTFKEFVEVVQDVVPDLVGDHATGAKITNSNEKSRSPDAVTVSPYWTAPLD